ncbi:MAG: lipid-A-disaccharide synthase [Zavarzinella sp.]
MHFFISAGEPSGEMHATNLIRALKTCQPDVQISGFGGDAMAAEGCQLLYPLSNHSVMGISAVLKQLRTFKRLLDQAEDFFRTQRPNALIMIDYPGFHWKLAERARKHGIPVYFFVPPQIWAWASWRVKKMKRLCDHVFSCLPFEHEWLEKHGVPTTYIGHPYFDELKRRQLDQHWIEGAQKGGPVIGLLPGSRNQEVLRNLKDMLGAAKLILSVLPQTRFLVASYNSLQADMATRILGNSALPVTVYVGKTPEIIAASQACLAVSGSVSLELMYYRTPAVITYRIKRLAKKIKPLIMNVRFITLVNLLADKQIFPEVISERDCSKLLANKMLDWLENPTQLQAVRAELTTLAEAIAQPGACAKLANWLTASHSPLKQQ